MNREDAEEAMEACSETDPFNVGRLLMMRWGKNVKKTVKRGTGGGIALGSVRRARQPTGSRPQGDSIEDSTSDFQDDSTGTSDGPPRIIEMNHDPSKDISTAAQYQSELHAEDSIVVEIPTDPNRFGFISTVASYVSKDGSSIEQKLIETEADNPLFSFLVLKNSSENQRREHIFYRWRVYSFCQGDGYSSWRTKPFVMFHPHGRYWIPPPLNQELARQEEQDEQDRENTILQQKKDRRKMMGKREFLTGRQLERARVARRKGSRKGANFDGGANLSDEEIMQFDLLVKKKLSISRETICAAMAFCFEKSGAAKQIAALLKEALEDDSPGVTVEMRIARLYLLSDILFNSQQPGVRNAFMYRDAVEKMAPDIFTSLGKHGGGNLGRMTMHKLKTAVSSVLGAWTEWSVYNPSFLDELEARFEGRPIEEVAANQAENVEEEAKELVEEEIEEPTGRVILDKPRGDWKEVQEEAEDYLSVEDTDGAPLEPDEVDGTEYDDDADGEPLTIDDVDGEAMDDGKVEVDTNVQATEADDDIDGTELDYGGVQNRPSSLSNVDDTSGTVKRAGLEDIDDVDGCSIEGNEIDGAPIDSFDSSHTIPGAQQTQGASDHHSKDVDVVVGEKAIEGEIGARVVRVGQEMDEEALNGEALDGEAIDGEALDGDAVDGEALDGEAIDGADLDGEAIDGEEIEEDDLDGEPL